MLFNIVKELYRSIFPPKYNQGTYQICGVKHQLQCDDTLFNKETLKLYSSFLDFYDKETEIFQNSNVGMSSYFAFELLKLSPISICSDLDAFYRLFEASEYDLSIKRWQDLIVTINTYVDSRVLDVYMGRYFKQVVEQHANPYHGLSEEMQTNICEQYLEIPWSWMLVPYIQATASRVSSETLISLQKPMNVLEEPFNEM